MRLLGEQNLTVSQPAGEEVFKRIRRMILDGELKDGERLIERRLGEMLNVSRTPVREALRKLEAEGLLRREPYHGLLVAKLTPEDAVEILSIREVLEGLAANLAAARRSTQRLRTLRGLLGKMEKAFAGNDSESFGTTHIEFHETICAAAESPRLLQLVSSVEEYLHSFTSIGYRLDGRSRQACQEHREILECIATRDGVVAEEKARAHVRHSREALLAVLNRDTP